MDNHPDITTESDKPVFLSTGYVAGVLGVRARTVRQWREWNDQAGRIAYGPPYARHGDGRAWYPQEAFNHWCATARFMRDMPSVNPPA
jgi:hypothetical protein